MHPIVSWLVERVTEIAVAYVVERIEEVLSPVRAKRSQGEGAGQVLQPRDFRTAADTLPDLRGSAEDLAGRRFTTAEWEEVMDLSQRRYEVMASLAGYRKGTASIAARSLLPGITLGGQI